MRIGAAGGLPAEPGRAPGLNEGTPEAGWPTRVRAWCLGLVHGTCPDFSAASRCQLHRSGDDRFLTELVHLDRLGGQLAIQRIAGGEHLVDLVERVSAGE